MPDVTPTEGILAAVTAMLVAWTGKLQLSVRDPRIDRLLEKVDAQGKQLSDVQQRVARIEGRLDK